MTTTQAPFVAPALDYRARALKSVAFGVSSTPRGRQLPAPVVVDRAEGAHVWDISGSRFVDYALGYGPLILGHTPAPVLARVRAELDRGLRTATVHKGEAELGELIADTLPSAELSAFVSSGSEAIQLALRIARASTGRTKVVKFRGNYHGWFDNIQVAGTPGNDGADAIGQDPGAAASVVPMDWGDLAALEAELTTDFAAVILEPVAVNGGCFMPPEGFLQGVRDLTRKLGIVLIFDEVITGYRLDLGGAQRLAGVTPDLTVIGKAMGAGFPISAVAGTQAAMEPVSSGRLLHRGTFNGNPVSVGAACACIAHLRDNATTIYPGMDTQAADLAAHIRATADAADLPLSVARTGSALQIFMGLRELTGLSDLPRIDRDATMAFTGDLLVNGVQAISRGLMYLSAAHTDDDIAVTKDAFTRAIAGAAARLD
ncbi:aspartate aminotransferase family protein [Chachezhania sediminis]|uniref:aspartate aminotransferase family protein n=1 Tax=Chachezhania sediminis TaxID=2599291 RepID=UPI00131C57DE|nr:aminotransferase class III-fold pyridoxal phosphate-dependent enzyme [Chachezhania sediminis]